MSESREVIEELARHPRESLTTELKAWIDPDTPSGQALIISTALALRNQNGGYILVGFDNATREASDRGVPDDPRIAWHGDKIQRLVTKYASELFEVHVDFVRLEGQIHPVISIPSGVRVPVATKRSLANPAQPDSPLIRKHVVFVRTLATNNTPSTAPATWRDWGPLVERCFSNREADVGGFVRRQLAGTTAADLIRQVCGAVPILHTAEEGPVDAVSLLRRGHEARDRAFKSRGTTPPSYGTWEVASLIKGEFPVRNPDETFLTFLDVNNPDYTGWPMWLNSRGFRESTSRPYVQDGGWEALIAGVATGHHDFWRIEPAGYFYLWRVLQDDVAPNRPTEEPGRYLDFALVILRVTEALAVPLHFARMLGCDPAQTRLAFAFRWSGLAGRELASWSNPARRLSIPRVTRQDEVLSQVEVPLMTAESALGPVVAEVTTPLFNAFDGWAPAAEIVDDLASRLLERRL